MLNRWVDGPNLLITYSRGCGGVVSEGEVKKGLMGGSARKLTWGHTHRHLGLLYLNSYVYIRRLISRCGIMSKTGGEWNPSDIFRRKNNRSPGCVDNNRHIRTSVISVFFS